MCHTVDKVQGMFQQRRVCVCEGVEPGRLSRELIVCVYGSRARSRSRHGRPARRWCSTRPQLLHRFTRMQAMTSTRC